ncbi:TIGR00730 family Rossman fold protein [uncultured Campylobacter sp.]|uniref:LOG family protein n=1 Tax=uncultured Campylobacter sp. TaxID=218934 RepID=UPI0026042262|nr:TIGR00730 family Rossman fold protein [uncultured Campylobacter sp.]
MQLKEILKDIKIARDNLKNVGKSATIFGSARFSEDNRYVKDAQKLCEGLADLGYSIITGGGGGIMQGANRGAFARARTHSVGFNIMLPFEQKSNGFLTQGAKFSAFAPRKGALIENSEIFVIFPGGFGTLDEFFEILVLVQTGFKRAHIYLYDEEFYAPLMEFFRTSLLKSGAINESDLQNFKLCDSVDEILTDVRTGENE